MSASRPRREGDGPQPLAGKTGSHVIRRAASFHFDVSGSVYSARVMPAGLWSWKGQSGLQLRGMASDDRAEVIHLLEVLPVLYPGGGPWLRHRLDDVIDGGASCTIAQLGERICGISILTPKRSGALKFSTLFVAEWARRQGVGSRLVDEALTSPAAECSTETYITVAHQSAGLLTSLLHRRGFTETALERDRYGLGRHEIILTKLAK